MNVKSALGTIGVGLGLYSVYTGVKEILRDREDYLLRKGAEQRYNAHNHIHNEESGVLYQDYLERILPAVNYLESFRHEGRPDRRASRKVYHSQMATLSNEQLATLFAAGLAFEHYSLEYHDLFKDQTLVFKSYQTRYVRPEELHTDAADLLRLSYPVQELIDTEKYISGMVSSHSKTKLMKFIIRHRTDILELLERNDVAKAAEVAEGSEPVV